MPAPWRGPTGSSAPPVVASMTPVVFLINSLAGGGAEKQLLLTATVLAESGHACTIVTLRGVPRHPRMAPFIAAALAAGVEWWEAAAGKRFDWAQVRRLRRRLRARPGPVLWSWGYRADVVRLVLGLLGCRPRTLVALRSADGPRLARYRWYWRLLCACSDVLVSNTWLNLEQVDAVAPGARQRGVVIYNALDGATLAHAPVVLAERPAALRIVLLGNILIDIKGYDLLIPLARMIRDCRLPWTLLVGGSPFEGRELQDRIERAAVGGIVRLEGQVADPLAFLSSGHVFLMLSRVEGMPNALLEAMSVGLPAVCTRVGDVPRFAADRAHLRLVEQEDAAGAFRALEDLWRDWPEAVAMGRRGRILCRETFSLERMRAETLALLDRFSQEVPS